MRHAVFAAALSLLLLAALAGCGGNGAAARKTGTDSGVSQLMEQAAGGTSAAAAEKAERPGALTTAAATVSDAGVDIDLTAMSSTMVFAEVSNMMISPEDYVGKTVRMRGEAVSTYYDETETTYYSVIVADATACCAQGLEYLLSDADAEYPADGMEITVSGQFEMYEELGMPYCRLRQAAVEG